MKFCNRVPHDVRLLWHKGLDDSIVFGEAIFRVGQYIAKRPAAENTDHAAHCDWMDQYEPRNTDERKAPIKMYSSFKRFRIEILYMDLKRHI